MISSNDFLKILGENSKIGSKETENLKEILEKFPYFQVSRALYLKGLKNQESYEYNKQLKIAAAYTADRSILFDYISSDDFRNQQNIENTSTEIPKIEPVENEKEEVEEILDLGKPLDFEKNDYLSFSEWLQVGSVKKVSRSKIGEIPKNITGKLELIDKFIASNPKMKTPNTSGKNENIAVESTKINDHIMTETLAKVYLEQKKYDSAIKAYRILSLKYPKKSVLFANQIKAIKVLQKNK
ncbi:hypothetical protein [Aureivirga sp. CE67]|uniref:hypothetical protein n=1 Tax=Aureivirga sp. CE67 TaxID=1788983 RepID=UPI0018CB2971|nr:hypothetical protein [Aureivirga sp. CE67]